MMINSSAILIVVTMIVCSSVSVSPLNSSDVSRILFDSRKLEGRLGCIKFGVGMLKEMDESYKFGDHPNEVADIIKVVTKFFEDLNQPSSSQRMELSKSFRHMLDSFVQECLLVLHSSDVEPSKEPASKEILPKKSTIEEQDRKTADQTPVVYEDFDFHDDRGAPAYEYKPELGSMAQNEPEIDPVKELGSQPIADSVSKEVFEIPRVNVPELDEYQRRKKNIEELREQYRLRKLDRMEGKKQDLNEFKQINGLNKLDEFNERKQRNLDKLTERHRLNVKNAMQKQQDELRTAARLQNAGITSKNYQAVHLGQASKIKQNPDIKSILLGIGEARQRLDVIKSSLAANGIKGRAG